MGAAHLASDPLLEDDPDLILSLLHPLRRQLLGELDAPDSATGLGRRLGLPRQKVNYHLRELENLGLVRRSGERQRRGLTEHLFVRARADLLVDPFLFESGPTTPVDSRGLRAVVSAAVQVLRSVNQITRRMTDPGQRVASLTLDAKIRLSDPDALAAFQSDLIRLIEQHDQPSTAGAMRFAVTSIVLPVLPAAESP